MSKPGFQRYFARIAGELQGTDPPKWPCSRYPRSPLSVPRSNGRAIALPLAQALARDSHDTDTDLPRAQTCRTELRQVSAYWAS
jgi:hypothetical protein